MSSVASTETLAALPHGSERRSAEAQAANFLEVRTKLLSYRALVPKEERLDYVVEVVPIPQALALGRLFERLLASKNDLSASSF